MGTVARQRERKREKKREEETKREGEDSEKRDHLRLTTCAQRISRQRCTFVPRLYFGSKNAATRPVLTRVSRGSSFSRLTLFSSASIEILFSANERRLRAFALTVCQFVRISLSLSFYLAFSRSRLLLLCPSLFLFVLERRCRVHPLSSTV